MEKRYDIAYDFATKAYKKFQRVIKSIVLFGSTAKHLAEEKSDIDIIIIVDDCSIQWDQELTAWYRQEMGTLIASLKYSKKLHVNTVTLSAFWNQMITGEPVVINVIRYGIPLIDFGGFFNPLKVLLSKGRIRPTPEAIYNALRRAPMHLSRAKFSILASIEAVYWAMVDSSHAALMAANVAPPSPEQIDIMLKEHFVKKGLLKQKYVDWYKELYALAHYVSHGEVADLKGKEIQDFRDKADKFVGEMASLVKKLEE
tara:strand:- start:418 stop:1188 length:771 start_codon:yes stop_codon:yes gene_type:complete